MEKSVNWTARRAWLEKALYVDTIRGEDSTGLALVKASKDILLYKKAMAGYDFINMAKVDKLLYNIDTYDYVIGHNRWATKGKKTAVNAHPFSHGNITLVHNGTLISFNGLKNEFPTDSEAICKAFSTAGAEDVLPKLDGAYALVWYDSTDHTLHMARNDERPMHFAYSTDGKALFYASEPWMISGIMPKTYNLEAVEKLPIGRHFTFKLGATKIEESKKSFDILAPTNKWADSDWYGGYGTGKGNGKSKHNTYSTPAEKQLLDIGYIKNEVIMFSKLKVTKYTEQADGYFGTIKGETITSSGVVDLVVAYNVKLSDLEKDGILTETTNLTGVAERAYKLTGGYELVLKGDSIKLHVVKELPAPEEEDNNVIKMVLGPDGKNITEEEYEKLIKRGCSFCSCNLSVDDAEDLDWSLQDDPICYDCAEKLYSD